LCLNYSMKIAVCQALILFYFTIFKITCDGNKLISFGI
jgi:hypothetical protein